MANSQKTVFNNKSFLPEEALDFFFGQLKEALSKGTPTKDILGEIIHTTRSLKDPQQATRLFWEELDKKHPHEKVATSLLEGVVAIGLALEDRNKGIEECKKALKRSKDLRLSKPRENAARGLLTLSRHFSLKEEEDLLCFINNQTLPWRLKEEIFERFEEIKAQKKPPPRVPPEKSREIMSKISFQPSPR
ncbi:MAG TPA: hypothetical protein DD400_01835 [Rhodospirillaceae bacterium]|nr:hypothetical protein [Rhodospirillaceae bacterium]